MQYKSVTSHRVTAIFWPWYWQRRLNAYQINWFAVNEA